MSTDEKQQRTQTDHRAEAIKDLQSGLPFICIAVEGEGDHVMRWGGLTEDEIAKYLDDAAVGQRATRPSNS